MADEPPPAASTDPVPVIPVGPGPVRLASAELLSAIAEFVRGKIFRVVFVVLAAVAVFGAERVGGWIESGGWNIVSRVFGIPLSGEPPQQVIVREAPPPQQLETPPG